MALLLLALLFLFCPSLAQRQRYSLDANFLFFLGEAPGYTACFPNTSFPLALDGVEGSGLQPMGVVVDEDACMNLCCSSASCQIYNYCPQDSVGGCSGSAPSTCWIGSLGGVLQNNTKWKGRGRWSLQPPPPSTTGPQTLAYQDDTWRGLSLPHDYVVWGNYTNTSSLEGHGFLSSGVAWYRRHLVLNASEMQGKALWLDIDGAYRATDVWLNGAFLGHHESGYTSFRFYLHNATDPFTGAPAIRWDQDNVLAFRLDGRDFEGWWYEGSGLYRHMWLSHTSPLFIVPWSIYAPAFVVGDVVAPQGPTGPVTSPGGAILHVSVDLYNDPTVAVSAPGVVVAAVNASLLLTLRDGPTGSIMSTVSTPTQALTPGNWSRVRAVMNVSGPLPLWCLADPHLVTLTVAVVEQPTAAGGGGGGGVGGGDADAETITTGIRRAVFDARRGFLLNDQPTPIRGFCNHQDFGGCGTALPDRVNAFKVSTLKGIGANAWRTSHNPVNPELMGEFDAQGMLALVELRHFVDSPGYLEEARDMVLRDRNHPSILGWSLCNEGGCGVWGGEEALATAATTGAHFKDAILQVDPSRPLTAAVRGDGIPADSDPWMRGVVSVVDVMGINYSPFLAAQWTQLRPFQPTLGTEQGSCQSDRATLAFDPVLGYVGEDFNADCTPTNGQAVAQGGFYAGSFDWTGFDYRGEPNPLGWPDTGSHFGVFDAAGFPKAGASYYGGWWGATPGAVAVFPHWSRPASDAGKTVTLSVYAAAAACQLFINGIPQKGGDGGVGPQAMPPKGFLQWRVVYTPGNVSAVCSDGGGGVVGIGSSVTAVPPTTLRLHLDAPAAGAAGVAGDGADVALLSVSVHDASGVLVPATPPTPAPLITFSVTGDGELYGLANGDPASHEMDKNCSARTAFGGLVRAIVRAAHTGGRGGQITVSVSAPGLIGDTLVVPVTGVSTSWILK